MVARRFDRLLHLGNAVVDVVLDVDALPERGGDVLARRTVLAAGGGFNVMAAAARQGVPVLYAGAHGTGPFGDLVRRALREAGITVFQPRRDGLDTGFVVCAVDAGGERTFLTSPGAEGTLTPEDIAGLEPGPRDAVYLSGYSLVHPANRAALSAWLRALPEGIAAFFDPGPLVADIPPDTLDLLAARASWWTCNAREAALLTGHDDPAAACAALSARVHGGVLVRTGPDGCLLAAPDGREPRHVPGFAVEAVDLNGAGDAHAGVFMARLAAGDAPRDAARLANAAAALAVTRPGPATAPTADGLAAFLADR